MNGLRGLRGRRFGRSAMRLWRARTGRARRPAPFAAFAIPPAIRWEDFTLALCGACIGRVIGPGEAGPPKRNLTCLEWS